MTNVQWQCFWPSTWQSDDFAGGGGVGRGEGGRGGGDVCLRSKRLIRCLVLFWDLSRDDYRHILSLPSTAKRELFVFPNFALNKTRVQNRTRVLRGCTLSSFATDDRREFVNVRWQLYNRYTPPQLLRNPGYATAQYRFPSIIIRQIWSRDLSHVTS